MSWLLKYKIHHILFWVAYYIFWTSLSMRNYGSSLSKAVLATTVYFIGQGGTGYWFMYYLVPRYFFAKRYSPFAILGSCGILLGSFFITACMTALFYSLFTEGPNTISFGTYFAYSCLSVFFSAIMFFAAGVIKERVQTQKMHALMEKEKTENELKFLKSQINPHFLFNAMNSIYVLIKKDPELAAATLAKFSDMLRYQLYECNFSEVPIAKEIEYLNNYIELERLRKDGTLSIDYQTDLEKENFFISPLLIIPFVENAFKHVSNFTDRKNFIDISLNYGDGLFGLLVRNSADLKKPHQIKGEVGGIGQDNTKRRLNLIYPGRHTLIVEQGADIYYISLTIQVQ
jgi:two-component system, LytTR family, sensor kinase